MSAQLKPHVLRWRTAHHAALRIMRQDGNNLSGLQIWQKLRRIEAEAHQLAEDCCNFLDMESAEYEQRREKVESKVKAVFGGSSPPGFFVNLDPRGYALKLESGSFVAPAGCGAHLQTDLGGYQILAAEID